MSLAAEFSAADTDTAQDLRLIPHADLPQFDSCPEHCRQIFDQFPKVHAVVRGEIKQQLAVVECAFHIYQIHFQLSIGDLLLADLKSTFFLFAILFQCPAILPRGDPQDRLQRHCHLLLGDLFIGDRDFSAFRPAGSFGDDKISLFHLPAVRREIVDLSAVLKPNADDFNHTFFLSIVEPTPRNFISGMRSCYASMQSAQKAASASGRLTFASIAP